MAITIKKEKAMTKAQAFATLIDLVGNSGIDKADDIITILQKEIDAMERKNERAKEKAQEKKEPMRKAVEKAVTQMDEDTNYTLEDICGLTGIEGITPMKLRPMLNPFTDNGTLTQMKDKGKSTFVKLSAEAATEE